MKIRRKFPVPAGRLLQNRLGCDGMLLPERAVKILTVADQESQTGWEAYAKYKRQLNDIPLDPLMYMEILRRLAEIFDL